MLKRITLSVLALALSAPAWAIGPTVCDKSTLCKGLAFVYEFKEPTDSPREDSLSGGNFLIEPAGVNLSHATGKWGDGVTFAGTGTSYLKYRYSGLGGGVATYEFWIYPTALPASGQYAVLLGADVANQRGHTMGLYNNAGTTVPYISVLKNDGTYVSLVGTTAISANPAAPYQIVFAINENHLLSGQAYLGYSVNGAALTTTALNPSSNNYPVKTYVGEVDLGRSPYGGGGSPFTGRIDRYSAWGRVLTNSEISLSYNGGDGAGVPVQHAVNTKEMVAIFGTFLLITAGFQSKAEAFTDCEVYFGYTAPNGDIYLPTTPAEESDLPSGGTWGPIQICNGSPATDPDLCADRGGEWVDAFALGANQENHRSPLFLVPLRHHHHPRRLLRRRVIRRTPAASSNPPASWWRWE